MNKRYEKSIRSTMPVTRRLFAPLALLLVLLLLGVAGTVWMQRRESHFRRIADYKEMVFSSFDADLQQQVNLLRTTLSSMVNDPRVHHALRDRNKEQLLQDWAAVYTALHQYNDVTHLSFFDADRHRLLRVHLPELSDGINDRSTMLKAERTQMPAWGIELHEGSRERLTLRVVHPVLAEGTLIGYVELGKEVEHIIALQQVRFGSQTALLLRKDSLNREQWEAYMREMEREPDWEQFSEYVLSYASSPSVSPLIALYKTKPLLKQGANEFERIAHDATGNGRDHTGVHRSQRINSSA